ncbi:hypothetical protein SAMN04488096_101244 [Mesonia phycicola]|uniref:CarboxypepD_reg-like domain-containing protein n=1 Tax=Mesonia phycicola TaxID=579105 RepID=A0A1M6AFM4_9FLAO|nr:hypothetical protein [Mesonia phycicola]SHI35212.1 hypothetical protein SAMN04488096_101244 [Mesonia phycicola]
MRNTTILFFLIFNVVLSQEKQFSGVIIADSIAFTQVNIVNLTQEIGTVNNTKGEFAINANIGDEIIFSSIQYETYQITLTQENFLENTTIYLLSEVNELEEVKISNISLTGNLTKDAANLKTTPYFYPSSVGLPNAAPVLSVEERRLYSARTGGPVGLLVDVLSGRMAMLKRMKEIADAEGVISKSKKMVTTHFIVNDLQIPEDYIDDFFYFCSEDENFKKIVNTNDKLKMIVFLNSKKELYLKHKEWK